MLGTEPQVVDSYVKEGQVQIIYWPMLDHGNASLNAHAAADCVGRQDVDAFWTVHDQFYANQGDLWRADREYFLNAAASAGVDPVAFGQCYDSGLGHATVTELDSIRRNLGVFNRPTFDINGQLLVGSQPFEVFANIFNSLLQ